MILSDITDHNDVVNRDVSAVIALTPEEIRQFFAGSLRVRLEALLPKAQWCVPRQTTPDQWENLFRKSNPEIVVSAWETPRIPSGLSNLKYVCHLTGSVRVVLSREHLTSGLKVSNWGGLAAPLVAEQGLLLILCALRSLPRWQSFLAGPYSHEDKNRLETRSLRGRRVSIHGFGQIARELVKLLKPFDAVLSAYSAGVPDDLMLQHGVRPVKSLEELATVADILISCEALTDANRNSINREVLSKLEPGSVFVNVGRGAIVDEQALVEVATKRNLRVACDVFTTEPLPLDSPLRRIPGALYSPHMAGPTLDWYPRCGQLALENITRYLRGEPLLNQLTLDVFDRST